jgi:hypothetical protein
MQRDMVEYAQGSAVIRGCYPSVCPRVYSAQKDCLRDLVAVVRDLPGRGGPLDLGYIAREFGGSSPS